MKNVTYNRVSGWHAVLMSSNNPRYDHLMDWMRIHCIHQKKKKVSLGSDIKCQKIIQKL